MTDKTASQTHNAAPASAPFAIPGMDMFRKAGEAQMARVQAFYDSAAQWETRGAEQSRGAIDESARLMHETMKYASQMTAEWRKLSLDAVRNAMQMFTPSV
ncbi:MAG: hypothetical protein WCJ30_17310 [Deltaproteobacteria bacterium]